MSKTTLFVCSACRFPPDEASRNGVSGGRFDWGVAQALAERDLQDVVCLEPVRCMAGCQQLYNVIQQGKVVIEDTPGNTFSRRHLLRKMGLS